ncbi:MAG: EamA family transporter, partial [Rudaea sp.]
IPLFGEHHDLDLAFYLGVAIIIGSVLIHPLLENRHARSIETNIAGGID